MKSQDMTTKLLFRYTGLYSENLSHGIIKCFALQRSKRMLVELWFPSLAQSTAGDSCMTKVGGVNMELELRETNTLTRGAGLTTKACQSGLIKQILGELY